MECRRTQLLLESAVRERVFPGGVAIAGNAQGPLAELVAGSLTDDPLSAPVTPDTVYDIASLTKVVVTATLAREAFQNGSIRLDDTLADRLAPTPPDKAQITIRHLLTHTSGLPAEPDLSGAGPGRDSVLRSILSNPVASAPGTRTVYSDAGFILLGHLLETVGGEALDRAAQRLIFAPRQMKRTSFNPPPSREIAPTGSLPAGVVHDPVARFMGGVAGHAGLFSTARDLASFSAHLLRTFDPADPFFHAGAGLPGSTRTLGWDTPSPEGSSAGQRMSRRSIGHTGFTGTSLWIDPDAGVFVILLTNRVYPDPANLRIREFRPLLHDTICEELR